MVRRYSLEVKVKNIVDSMVFSVWKSRIHQHCLGISSQQAVKHQKVSNLIVALDSSTVKNGVGVNRGFTGSNPHDGYTLLMSAK